MWTRYVRDQVCDEVTTLRYLRALAKRADDNWQRYAETDGPRGVRPLLDWLRPGIAECPRFRNRLLWRREFVRFSGEAQRMIGGESGIRTHGRVSPTHAFQACAFNHSAISPSLESYTCRGPSSGRNANCDTSPNLHRSLTGETERSQPQALLKSKGEHETSGGRGAVEAEDWAARWVLSPSTLRDLDLSLRCSIPG